MLQIGAFLAGLFLIVRPLPGIVQALSTGVLVRKGHGAVRITRDAEPERFRALLRQRFAEMAPGLFLLMGLAGWIVMTAVRAG